MPAHVRRAIRLTFVVQEEDGQYSAVCHPLETASCGNTIDEALSNLREAVQLHLEALEEAGLRDEWFAEHGIEFLDGDDGDTIPVNVNIPRGGVVAAEDYPINCPS